MPIEKLSSSYPDWPPIISIRVTGDASLTDLSSWVRDNASGARLRVELGRSGLSPDEVEAAVAHEVASLEIDAGPEATLA